MTDLDKSANVVTYEIRVTDPYGEPIKIVDEFTALDYARKVNSVGELALSIEDKGDINVFKPENRIEVWRMKGDNAKLDLGAVWFIHTVSRHHDSSGARYFEVEAHDQIGLLPRRIIPYNEGNPTTQKQAEGDDVIKEIMRENFGAAATDVDRDLTTYLTVQGDTTLAPQVTIFCAKDNVFDVIQEIADTCYENGTFLAFDLVYNPNVGTFEFRTYVGQRGVDRSVVPSASALILGVEYGSLESAVLLDDRGDEKNYIYAGAKDLVGIVPPQTAFDLPSIGISPFHRKEFFMNASSSDDADELQDEADMTLEERRYRARIEATLSQEFARNSYGELFDFGDKVSVSVFGKTYTVFANAISVKVDKNGEKINVVLEGTDD